MSEAEKIPSDQPIKGPAGNQRKKIFVAAGGTVALILGAYFVYQSYFFVSSDNAMIQAPSSLLSSKVGGIVVRCAIRENQHVKAGDLLAEIRPDDYQNALANAEAELASLQAQFVGAESEYHRIAGLFQHGAATHERLDSTKAQYDSMHAKTQAAEARAAQARLDLEYTKIKAPVDGRVGRKSFEVGMLANPGQPLLGFVSDEERWVVANLKETDMSEITEGKAAVVQVDALPGRKFEGVVESISPSTGATFSLLPPDNATGNFTKVVQRVPVRIKLLHLQPSDMDRLQAGLSAEVTVKIR